MKITKKKKVSAQSYASLKCIQIWVEFYSTSHSAFSFFFSFFQQSCREKRKCWCCRETLRQSVFQSPAAQHKEHASRLWTKTKTPTQKPTNAYGAIHTETHINTINHTHALKKLHWNKLQPFRQAAPTAVSWLQQAAGKGGGQQRASNRWLKLDKRLGDVITRLQVNQRGAIWAPCPGSR